VDAAAVERHRTSVATDVEAQSEAATKRLVHDASEWILNAG
jgi:hypothetical protein